VGWCDDRSKPYYFQRATGESTWTKPEALSSGCEWFCSVCGAETGEVSTELVGTWVYGLHGCRMLHILDGELRYRISEESTGTTADLRHMSWWDDQGTSHSSWFADMSESLQIRVTVIGAHALRIDWSEDSGGSWPYTVLARRRHGGTLLGEWSIPVWDYTKLELSPNPDCWQCFSVVKPMGSFNYLLTEGRGEQEDRFCYGPVLACEKNELVQGTLYREGLRHVASMRKENGKPAGSVTLKVEADHLVYRYDEGAEVIALRGGHRGVACCERCGLASLPPSAREPYPVGHCTSCGKCIPGFDHHCFFLNQCVGKRNYNEWLLLILSVFASTLVASISAAYVLSQWRIRRRHFSSAVTSHVWDFEVSFGGVQLHISTIVLAVAGIIGTVACLFLGQLIVLHMWLIAKRQTTAGSIFQTDSQQTWRRRRARHLNQSLQKISKRCTRNYNSLVESHDTAGQGQSHHLSPKLPSDEVTLGLFLTDDRMQNAGTCSPMSMGSSECQLQLKHHSRGSMPSSPMSLSPEAWCQSPSRRAEVLKAQAVCVGLSISDLDEDYSEILRQRSAQQGSVPPMRRSTSEMLSVPFLRADDSVVPGLPKRKLFSAPGVLRKERGISSESLSLSPQSKDGHERSPVHKAFSFFLGA